MKLLKKLTEVYKIPLLVSLTVFVIILALATLKNPIIILSTFLGALLGTFFLDLDYIIYAYFTDTDKDFSQTLKGYFKHKDYANAVSHIYYHREDLKEKTLHSVLFQVVIAGFALFMIFAPLNFFAKALVISTYVNSLYRLAEKYFKDEAEDWFWVLKDKPSRKQIKIYLMLNVVFFLITIQFL